jgi:hypothetical protein
MTVINKLQHRNHMRTFICVSEKNSCFILYIRGRAIKLFGGFFGGAFFDDPELEERGPRGIDPELPAQTTLIAFKAFRYLLGPSKTSLLSDGKSSATRKPVTALSTRTYECRQR